MAQARTKARMTLTRETLCFGMIQLRAVAEIARAILCDGETLVYDS